MLSPASGRSPGARPGPEAAPSRVNRRPQGPRRAPPRAGTGHLGGAGSRQRQVHRRSGPARWVPGEGTSPGKVHPGLRVLLQG